MTLQSITPARLLAEGGRLLTAIAGDSRITFQTFDDSPASRKTLVRVMHGSLSLHAGALADLNRQGASINFMVNHGDGKRRAADNVLAVRALFVDLDGAPIEPVMSGPLTPHAIVQSSPGKFHAYWLVEGVQLHEFQPLQRSLAGMFGGDAKVTDLPRVMRLPGSIHWKGDPVPCQLLELREAPRYARDEVLEAIPLVGPKADPKPPKLTVLDGSIPEGERNRTLFNLARGFVNKGFEHALILDRIQVVNANKCAVPLCATEVDAIVASAVRYGPAGFLNLPLAVCDSPAYRGLSHAARTLAVAAYRRYNGENNGNIALVPDEFRLEFSREETFYTARKEVVDAGLLKRVTRRCYIAGVGWRPDLFEVALTPPGGASWGRSAAN